LRGDLFGEPEAQEYRKVQAQEAAEEPFRVAADVRKRDAEKPAKGRNVYIPGLESGIAVSPRITYDDRTFLDRGVKKNIADYPGAQFSSASITGKSPEDVAGIYTSKLEAKERVEARKHAGDIGAQIASTTQLLQDVTEAGWRAVGPLGWSAEKIGGLLGGINPPAGKSITKWISGVSPEALGKLRIASRAFSAQLIEPVTGEAGARKSDFEMRLTNAVSRINDPASSYEQIIGALGGALGMRLVNYEKALIESGTPLKYDLDTDVGVTQQIVELAIMGLTDEQANDTLQVIKLQRDWMRRSGYDITIGEPGG
jgi:hypothetical protein